MPKQNKKRKGHIHRIRSNVLLRNTNTANITRTARPQPSPAQIYTSRGAFLLFLPYTHLLPPLHTFISSTAHHDNYIGRRLLKVQEQLPGCLPHRHEYEDNCDMACHLGPTWSLSL